MCSSPYRAHPRNRWWSTSTPTRWILWWLEVKKVLSQRPRWWRSSRAAADWTDRRRQRLWRSSLHPSRWDHPPGQRGVSITKLYIQNASDTAAEWGDQTATGSQFQHGHLEDMWSGVCLITWKKKKPYKHKFWTHPCLQGHGVDWMCPQST